MDDISREGRKNHALLQCLIPLEAQFACPQIVFSEFYHYGSGKMERSNSHFTRTAKGYLKISDLRTPSLLDGNYINMSTSKLREQGERSGMAEYTRCLHFVSVIWNLTGNSEVKEDDHKELPA